MFALILPYVLESVLRCGLWLVSKFALLDLPILQWCLLLLEMLAPRYHHATQGFVDE